MVKYEHRNDTRAEMLEAAWELISTPDRWLKGTTKHGERYCSLGALRATADTYYGFELTSFGIDYLFEPLAAVLPHSADDTRIIHRSTDRVVIYNDADTTTHESLKAYWFEAIANLRAAEIEAPAVPPPPMLPDETPTTDLILA